MAQTGLSEGSAKGSNCFRVYLNLTDVEYECIDTQLLSVKDILSTMIIINRPDLLCQNQMKT